MTGQELKIQREKHKLTQKEVGDAINTSHNRISEWELGKFKISKSYQTLLKNFFDRLK